MRQIILASGSPRRKELMTLMGLDFTVVPSDFDEYLDHTMPAQKLAIELGVGKAMAVAKKYPNALVVGSDTLVTLRGKHLGKTQDEDEARAVLTAHNGETAVVTTSVVVVCAEKGLVMADVGKAEVFFKRNDPAAIDAYLKTGDWKDKAASWGIQSGAAPLTKGIAGDYDTILGLSTRLLADMLRSQGIDCHPAEVKPPAFE